MNLDKKYFTLINRPVDARPIIRNGEAGFDYACPECSHRRSTPRKRKMRSAYVIYADKYDRYVYGCNHCKISGNLENYLKKYQPDLYKKYKRENFSCLNFKDQLKKDYPEYSHLFTTIFIKKILASKPNKFNKGGTFNP